MFDQPNLKAKFRLYVAHPPNWKVISNKKLIWSNSLEEITEYFDLNEENEEDKVEEPEDPLLTYFKE
jgi:aminopeptidase N